MSGIPRKVHQAAHAEAARWGLAASIRHAKGKHPKVMVTNGVQARRLPISGSPRADQESQCNFVRQQVRRMARAMGDRQ